MELGSIITWIVVGLIAGVLADWVVKGINVGLIGTIIVGILGSVRRRVAVWPVGHLHRQRHHRRYHRRLRGRGHPLAGTEGHPRRAPAPLSQNPDWPSKIPHSTQIYSFITVQASIGPMALRVDLKISPSARKMAAITSAYSPWENVCSTP